MTYAPRPSELVPCLDGERATRTATAPRRPGLLRRFYEALFESRQKQVEREVAAYLERTGGRFTDDIERRLSERLISGDWRR
jgi:hypothetical protein